MYSIQSGRLIGHQAV